jgi:hypothetical protein
MIEFALQLKSRNETLFYFGLLCFVAAVVFLLLAKITSTQVYQVNAWYKPFKFAISTFSFAWAMAWYCHYLPSFSIQGYNWTVIVLLGFEIIYIALMAAQGKQSHYNVSTPFFSMMFSMMALAATLVTLYTAYVGFLFFIRDFPDLPTYYLWAIRIGIMLFVVFSFEGFLMGSKMSHSVGLVNDNSNLFILGWSKTVGDLRVAHFLGMHALQVLPILAFYIFKNTKLTLLAGALYGAVALFTLIQALNGKPIFTEKSTSTPTQHPNQI